MRRLLLVLIAMLATAPAAQAWSWPADGPVLAPFSFDPANPYAAGQHRGLDVGGVAGAAVRAPARRGGRAPAALAPARRGGPAPAPAALATAEAPVPGVPAVPASVPAPLAARPAPPAADAPAAAPAVPTLAAAAVLHRAAVVG